MNDDTWQAASAAWEPTLRLGCFLSVLVVMATWELAVPRRRSSACKSSRWLTNLGLMVFNTICVRICLPFGAVAAAHYASANHWGLLNHVDGPGWIKDGIAVVSLDLLIYLQHVVFHRVPWLWQIHRLHHADVDLDVTTGVRFHTLEILLSALVKVTAVLLLGCSITAVIVFEILLNAAAMMNHSNIKIPARIDRYLRLIIVTPDMHLVHHSADPRDHHRNFGFQLSCWDYLWRTYRAKPSKDLTEVTIGVSE